MLTQMERILKIKVGRMVKESIIFVDDVNKKIMRMTQYKALDEPTITVFSDLEPFPYSHHWR